MTKTFKNLSRIALFGTLAFSVASCADEYSMPAPNINPAELVEGVAFTVEHDSENPNIIHLKSLMPAQYSVAWVTPQGRRTESEVTLQIPFDGTYEVQLGVYTRGGYVWSEPYSFTIDDFCADFVSHYLWKRISGGVGNSKTWQLDLGVLEDESVKTTFWKGPHWYFTSSYTWDNLHSKLENENYRDNYVDSGSKWDAANAAIPCTDWYWSADYAGNTWMCDPDGPRNFGYITFDLIGGANVSITDYEGNLVGKGTYMLDTDNHTITLSDVYPLEANDSRTHERFLQLLYLSDDAMQVMAPSEGVTLNYVTKEYFENYTEPVPTEIVLPETWAKDLASQNSYCTWRLNERVPFDWYDLGGTPKNGFKGVGDYPGNLTPNEATVSDFRLDFNNPALGKYVVTLPSGDTVEGDYSIVDNGTNGYVTLTNGMGSTSLGGSSVKLEGNELTVLAVGYDDLGRMGEVVLGIPQKDVNGNVYEYLGYQFTADYGAEQKKTYRMSFSWFTPSYEFQTQDLYIQDPGTYTISMDFSNDNPYGVFLDCYKILNDYPNCDLYINEIKVDGNVLGLSNDDINHCPGDEPHIARRYILNPWGDTAFLEEWTPKFKVSQNLSITVTVSFENDKPFLPETEE